MLGVNPFLLFTRRFDELGASYMVTGSVAVIVYGEPRLTHDVDLVAELSPAQVERLPELFAPDQFYCPPREVIIIELRRDQRGHFNIIHHNTGF